MTVSSDLYGFSTCDVVLILQQVILGEYQEAGTTGTVASKHGNLYVMILALC